MFENLKAQSLRVCKQWLFWNEESIFCIWILNFKFVLALTVFSI